jgi:hypothetical protein
MPKHTHIDDLEALSIGEKVADGNCETIIICEKCREKIVEILTDEPSASTERQKWIKMMIHQMEMTAFFYQSEVNRITRSNGSPSNPEFQRQIGKIFGAKKVIGEGNKLADIVLANDLSDSKKTPLERPRIEKRGKDA